MEQSVARQIHYLKVVGSIPTPASILRGNMYLEQWSDWSDVQNDFQISVPEPETVFLAYYNNQDYSGTAYLLYYDMGYYYWAQGSHCSCMGLEDQFDPTIYTNKNSFMEAIEKYNFYEVERRDVVEVLNDIQSHNVRLVQTKPIIEI